MTKLILRVASSELDTAEVQEARETLLTCIERHELIIKDKNIVDPITDEDQIDNEEPLPDDQRPLSYSEEEVDNGEQHENNDEPSKNNKKKKTDLMSLFIDNLMSQVCEEKESKGQRFRFSGNRFYLATFVKKFQALLRYFPTWTGLMQDLFEHHEAVGSSARSETYFGQVKQSLVPKGTAPKRVDKFLVQHCRMVEARTIKAYARISELQPTPKPSRSLYFEDMDHIIAFENWRNRGSRPIPIEIDDEPVNLQESKYKFENNY